MSGPIATAFAGFAVSAGLIMAIGAQNAFVLRQGIARRHVFEIALFCAVSDALLIALGVGGVGSLIVASPALLQVATWGGAAFLGAYALLAFRRPLTPAAMPLPPACPDARHGLAREAEGGFAASRLSAIGTSAAFTFLNPHVYLDTVVLVGSVAATHGPDGRWIFGAGAVLASFTWFFSLGYGARLLAPLFARPQAWRVLDSGIGIVMLGMALMLVKRPL